MKIVLINPPIEDFYITSVRRQPLGLLYIASHLKSRGHTVELVNCHTPKKHILELPQQFSYLKKFIDHKDPLYRFPFGTYKRFGMSRQALVEKLKGIKSDLFLVSSLFTTYHEEVEDTISIIKSLHPLVPIAAGGYHPALFPEQFMQRTGVDAVILGEGESGITQLLSQFEKGEFKSGRIIHNDLMETNLDALHFPERSMLLKRDFNFYGKKGTAITASRGCPNRCSFCTSRKFWNGHYAYRSIDNVLSEIDECIQKFGVSQFNFEDDNLFINKKRAFEFLEGLIKYQEEKKIALDLSAMNGISIEKIDSDIIQLMHKAGFRELNVSLVTSSIKEQKKLGRPFSTFKFGEIVDAAKMAGMNVRAYYILGLPEQEKVEVLDTINYLTSLQVQSFPSVYYDINEKADKWKMQRSSAFYNENEKLSREDLIYLFNYNYLNSNNFS